MKDSSACFPCFDVYRIQGQIKWGAVVSRHYTHGGEERSVFKPTNIGSHYCLEGNMEGGGGGGGGGGEGRGVMVFHGQQTRRSAVGCSKSFDVMFGGKCSRNW